jgi:hypothetical protein
MEDLNVKDLRFGNLVKTVLTDEYHILDIYDLRVISEGNYQNSYNPDIKVFKPIRLNRDYLLNLGFEQCGYNLLYWRHPRLYNIEFAGINWADEEFPEYQFLNAEIYGNLIKIDYVHQIQNFFNILTDEELDISLFSIDDLDN